jgi:autotransporter strand-loop-strand O-heptosyltransferase
MPNSYDYFKKEVKDYFEKNISTTKNILDVGPGEGTYSNLIRNLGYKMDCVEIYEPYVSEYNLQDKYDNVIIGNVLNQDLSKYDFIILGDVLEHISSDDAQNLIKKIVNLGKECLVAVPFLMPQDGLDDNDHEKHLQEDLTPEVMKFRYPELECLYSNSSYGYYIVKQKRNKFEKSYVLYANENYFEIVNFCVKSLRTFSDLPIIVYLLNSDKKINVENVVTVKWNSSSENDNEMYLESSGNFYINRANESIYRLLIERPMIVKDALEKYSDVVAYVDSDSVATQYCDRIFDMYNSELDYPYFVEGIYEYLVINGRGGASNREDLSSTLEHHVCELFGINQYVRQKYRQTGYFVAGQNTIDFLEEWYWMCNHPKILKDFGFYAPFHEETIANALLWKYNRLDGLPYIYMNGNNETINKVFNEKLFTGEPRHLGDWFKIPGKEKDLLFVHGEKREKIREEMLETLKIRQPKLDTTPERTYIQNTPTNKIKLLFLAPHLSTGGMPGFLLRRIELLQEYCPEFEIFVVEFSNFSPVYVVQRNKIKEILPSTHFFELGNDKMKLIDIIKENEIDIVHVDEMIEGFDSFNQVPRSLMNELYSNDRTWKMVETCHNVWFDPGAHKLYHPDAYAFCTPYHKEKTFADVPSYGEVLEFPIEKKIVTNENKIDAQTELDFDYFKTHVINVGLWTSGKNQVEGIEIARLVEKSHPDIHFHFIGNQAPNFQQYWEPVMKNLPSNVTIWGERSDISTFMKAADVFMFNSTWECNPLVLREAASYGLKILARNLPQYMDMFTPYITPINEDINETKDSLLSLIIGQKNYNVPEGQGEKFALDHLKFYELVNSKEPKQQTKINSDIRITQYFVNQPFLEIKGDSDSTFEIKFFDEYGICHYHNKTKSNHWFKLNRQYFTKWNTKVWEDGTLIYDDTLNYKGKKVFISFDSGSLGDTIAWMPYVLEFKKKHECDVVISTHKNFLFEKVYPELEFVKPGSTVNGIHGMYVIGWFYNPDKEPEMPNTVPLQQTATNILGLDYTEILPRIDYEIGERPYEQKYVSIATNSTSGCKFWTKEGWQGLINHLHELGYKVINVSKEKNPFDNAEQISDTSMENTMNIIHHSEFFIGLSSGLSWLAWGMGKHVVMISNFTEPDHEFTTNCTRIAKLDVCNGCWNSPIYKFDKGDWDWCPVHKGTKRQFECHKTITSKMVIDQIQHLL